MAARPEISITVPQTPSPANKTEDENEAALSEMAGLFVLWARARMREGCTERRGCRITSGGIKTGAEMRGRAQRSGTEGVREMPDNIRRNRNRGRDAGRAQRSGTRGEAGRALCCNFDLLPHK